HLRPGQARRGGPGGHGRADQGAQAGADGRAGSRQAPLRRPGMKHSDPTALAHKLDEKAGTCRAIVETPKGRRAKSDYEPKSGLFKLKQLLPDGMSFPVDFGFVPSTLCDDGDPLDMMLLFDEPCAVGAMVEVRIIGAIEGEQTSEGGDRIRNDR